METSRFSGDPAPEETAAVIAALEQFLRDTTPAVVVAAEPAISPWKRAGLAEGVSRQPGPAVERL
jgi:hypothetical protein